jgi:4-coumarate--CoA ligase
MIHHSPLPDVEIPVGALTGYVLARAAELGDKPALIDGVSGRTLTYAALAHGISAAAGGLLDAGLRPGDVVALVAPNIPEYAVVFHAVAVAGGTVTTINPTYTEREIHHQLTESRARFAVVAEPFLATVTAATAQT